MLVSFGTAHAEGLSSLRCLKKRFENTFSEYEIVHAFTSEFVRKKLLLNNIHTNGLPDALKMLHSEKYQKVLVLPTHICNGMEYDQKIACLSDQFSNCFGQFFIGKPVFYFDKQGNIPERDFFIRLLAALVPADFCREKMQAVFVGHGVRLGENLLYQKLQKILEACHPSFTIGLLETQGNLSLEGTLKRLRQMRKQCVYLIPFLLFAGMHVSRDISGAGNHSWKTRFLQEGYEVKESCHGMMEFSVMQEFYIERARSYIQCM